MLMCDFSILLVYKNTWFKLNLGLKMLTCNFYFSGPVICPTQKGSELREDVRTLVQFWLLVHSDKKYLNMNIVPTSCKYLLFINSFFFQNYLQKLWLKWAKGILLKTFELDLLTINQRKQGQFSSRVHVAVHRLTCLVRKVCFYMCVLKVCQRWEF